MDEADSNPTNSSSKGKSSASDESPVNKKRNGKKRSTSRNFGIYALPVLVAIFLWYFLNKQLFEQFKPTNLKQEKQVAYSSKQNEINENSADLASFKDRFTDEEIPFKNELLHIENLIEKGELKHATKQLNHIAKNLRTSQRFIYLSALTLDKISELEQSNIKLKQSIEIYKKLFKIVDVDSDLLYVAGRRLVNRLQFLGQLNDAVKYNQLLVDKFKSDLDLINDLGVNYLLSNKPKQSKEQFTQVLTQDPNNFFAQCHYAFIIKQYENKINESIGYFKNCLSNKDPRVMDGRFFYHLGDALQRSNRSDEAYEFYKIAVENKVFMSIYQRSIYNEPNLKAQPWWTLEEITYKDELKELEDNWLIIKKEAMDQLDSKTNSFTQEDESLTEKGDWKQFNLFLRGKKIEQNCKKTPNTCRLIEKIESASTCTRGQVKFSVMSENTHVWPHCGPTNCRLRAHLGLKIPNGKSMIRVANETREWTEGKFIVFDDSFEHEVWHNSEELRVVLIVDIWHPDLSLSKRSQLHPI